jgi:Ca2+-binding RTX toxin-like protein
MGPNTSVTFQERNTTVNAAGFNFISGGGGNDTVNAGSNTTVMLGNGNDTVNIGLAGLVTLGNGNDNVTAGDLSSITLGNGNDTVTGGNDDIITVGNGNDTIYAGDWPKKKAGLEDVINLGTGNDTVYAGQGETINLGTGTGHDTVAFGLGLSPPSSFGYDQINNFSAQHDVIEFNKALFANYATVMGATQQVGHDTQIVLDVNDIITLVGVQASSLHASNFQFV